MKGVKRLGIVMSVLVLALIFSLVSVSASTIFSDNFNDNNLNGWSSDYFGSCETCSIFFDVGTDNNSNVDYDNTHYAWMEDDAAIYKWINTTGYQNISLSYCARTYSLGGSDRLRTGWKTGSFSSNWAGWAELENIIDSSWDCNSYNLGISANNGGVWIAFYLDNGEYDRGLVDNVVVSGNTIPTTDTTLPVCSVDYIQQKISNNIYNLVNPITYIAEIGDFYTYGSSSDTESNIINVQYNRTSPDLYILFTNADPVDGAFNELAEDWRSKPNDPDNFVLGMHQVCCKVTDAANNVYTNACKNFCLDTRAPEVEEVSASVEDCSEDGDYSNQLCISWSWTAQDAGCAGIDYYSAKLVNSSGAIIDSEATIEGTSVELCALEEGVYHAEVQAVDNAGNTGNSKDSGVVVVDTTNPVVTITDVSPTMLYDGREWITGAFSVSEEDEDDNLLDCKIKVNDIEWSVACNSEAGVDNNNCTSDGIESCVIIKSARDKACNCGSADITLSVDKTNPTIQKSVGRPSVLHNASWSWESFEGFLHYFLTSETPITLDCSDKGSGAQFVSYRIDGGNWITVQGSQAVLYLDNDGIRNLEYYCVDNVNWESLLGEETDKVDNIAPVTTKTIGTPKLVVNGTTYVTSNTIFNLNAVDSEVGCESVVYNIQEERLEIESPEPDCNRNFTIQGEECTALDVAYYSYDLLGNTEAVNYETDVLDNTAPWIIIHNPTFLEAAGIERCDQSVVVEVQDTCVGLNEASVYAELYNSTGSVVRTTSLRKAVYAGLRQGLIFEGLMDKQLPAGVYTLVIHASDLLGNENVYNMTETLSAGVYVEYLDPSSCTIAAGQSSNCNFGFHVCVRDTSLIDMCMNKLGSNPGLITPDMLNARISFGNRSAYVGLCSVSDSQDLSFGSKINGKTVFNLALTVNSNVSSILGTGSYDLDYTISALDLII